jgi:hypothetical protein
LRSLVEAGVTVATAVVVASVVYQAVKNPSGSVPLVQAGGAAADDFVSILYKG